MSQIWVIRSQAFLLDSQRSAVKRLRFGVTMLQEVELRQVVEGVRHIGVFRPEKFLPDVQGPQKQGFRLIVFLLIKVQASEVVGDMATSGWICPKVLSSIAKARR